MMQGTRWGLSIVFVSLATLLIGVGEARSQAAQLQLCNQSSQRAHVVVVRQAGVNDRRLYEDGWWIIESGNCNMTNIYLAWGSNVYFYADGDQGGIWSGNAQRFCVSEQAFSRFIDPSPGCPPGLIPVGFIEYTVASGSLFTWTMGN